MTEYEQKMIGVINFTEDLETFDLLALIQTIIDLHCNKNKVEKSFMLEMLNAFPTVLTEEEIDDII